MEFQHFIYKNVILLRLFSQKCPNAPPKPNFWLRHWKQQQQQQRLLTFVRPFVRAVKINRYFGSLSIRQFLLRMCVTSIAVIVFVLASRFLWGGCTAKRVNKKALTIKSSWPLFHKLFCVLDLKSHTFFLGTTNLTGRPFQNKKKMLFQIKFYMFLLGKYLRRLKRTINGPRIGLW